MFSPQSYCDYLLSVAEESTHPDSFRLHDRQRPALSRSERGSGILPFRYARGRRRQLRNFVPEIKEMKKALGVVLKLSGSSKHDNVCVHLPTNVFFNTNVFSTIAARFFEYFFGYLVALRNEEICITFNEM